ncbi:MAG: FAD-dependent oxidoreductase [Elusimicrobiota bacterium]
MSAERSWRCLICGYVHRGPNPPETCPICGAGASEFEPYAETPSAQTAKPRRWRCVVCLYIHEGDAPPDTCPVCGASADEFEPIEEPGARTAAGDGKLELVIVGAGIAGVTAAESARRASPDARITLLNLEERPPYYRLNLTRYLAGEVGPEALPIHPEFWYKDNDIRLLRRAEAAALDLDKKEVRLKDGSPLRYDKLILAAGAHPFVPPFPGTELSGASTLRTAEDADRILERAREGPCVCIGGGILGLETAAALAKRGAEVTLLESFEWLMPRQLDRRAGELMGAHVRKLGIKLREKASTEALIGDKAVREVRLEDGTALPAGLALITTGIRSNTHLARKAGLETRAGVTVDGHLRTSHPDVYAAGDLAEHDGAVYGLWNAAQYQGGIAGLNAVGVPTVFGGLPRSNTLKVLGLDLLSIGKLQPEDGSCAVVTGEADGAYRRFVFRDNALVGAILLGDTAQGPAVKKAVEGRLDFSGALAKRPSAGNVLRRLAELP